MVTGLLDTSILVDNLRSYPPAITWLANQRTQLGIARIVRMEVIEGTLDSRGLRRALILLKDFEHIELITSDLEWATDQLTRFHLSHNIGMMDCLIASASHRLQVPLYPTSSISRHCSVRWRKSRIDMQRLWKNNHLIRRRVGCIILTALIVLLLVYFLATELIPNYNRLWLNCLGSVNPPGTMCIDTRNGTRYWTPAFSTREP